MIAATGWVILLKLNSIHWFVRPYNLKVTWMTSRKNRAPLLGYLKICALFWKSKVQSHSLKSHSGSNILLPHIPLVHDYRPSYSWITAFSKFDLEKSRSKIQMEEVTVESYIACPISYWFTSPSFRVNRPTFSCDTAYQHLTKKNKVKVYMLMLLHNWKFRQSHRCLNGATLWYYTLYKYIWTMRNLNIISHPVFGISVVEPHAPAPHPQRCRASILHTSICTGSFMNWIGLFRWIPRTNSQLRGICFYLMTSSWNAAIFHMKILYWKFLSSCILP